LVLKILDLLLEHRKVRRVGEALLEEDCSAHQCRCLSLKEIVIEPLTGDERAPYNVS
jgi:hypothetical protein